MQAVGRKGYKWKSLSPTPLSQLVSKSFCRLSLSSFHALPRSQRSIAYSVASRRTTTLLRPYSTNSFSAPPCCPLCLKYSSIRLFAHQSRVRDRLLHQCDCCKLIFVSKTFHANENEAKLRYDAHRNELTEDNSGYRSSLLQLVEPLSQLLHATGDANLRGLDYGCGPTLAMAFLLHQVIPQCHVDSYDPIYQPNDSLLSSAVLNPYDFITMNEVIEHMSDPALELTRLWSMLRPGGMLAIGTQRVSEQLEQAQLQYMVQQTQAHAVLENSPNVREESGRVSVNRIRKDKPKPRKPLSPFELWWYARDFTHITFYSKQTFDWIEQHWQPSTSNNSFEIGSNASIESGKSRCWKMVFQSDCVWIAQKL